MLDESSVHKQTEELGTMISRVAAMSGTIREALTGRQSLPGGDFVKGCNELIEEIAFISVREDEQMFGAPMEDRRPVFRYQGILVHLQLMAATMVSLAKELEMQLRDGISLAGTALDHADTLFTQQQMILCTLQEAIRTGDAVHLRAVCKACQESLRLCEHCAAERGKPMPRGGSPPLFLKLLDLMCSLVHHEQEIVKLLVRWKGPTKADPALAPHSG